MISQETIDKIFQATHIEEVVSDFVKLKKRGVNLLGLCPFHNEKTPSFTVSPTKEIYKCFGCGKAGNSVNFIMEHEHLSYPETLRYLADKYKIAIEETYKPEEKEQRTERESMFVLLSAAQKYFTEQLTESEEGKTIAYPYLKERELSAATIQSFHLGWSPAGREHFSQWAMTNGFTRDMLLKTGLAYEAEADKHLYDRFHDRVIFPIHNVTGKVVGFGGRILKSNAKVAKYINSPETEVYQKSKILYGLFQGKNAIRQLDECIMVEGYMDVISLYQNGIQNVAATSGTSLTEDQLKLIKRFTENIIFLFDGDPAGQKAALRGLDMALTEGLNVRVVVLPTEEDPDSFARKNKEEDIRKYIKETSKNFIQFRYDLFKDEAEKDPAKKANLVKEIIASLALVSDTIKRSLFLQEAASILNMSEEVLIQELRRLGINKLKGQNRGGSELSIADMPAPHQEEVIVQEKNKIPQERKVIKDLLLYGKKQYKEIASVAHHVTTQLTDIRWKDKYCQKVFEEIEKAIAELEIEKTDTAYYVMFINAGDIEMREFVAESFSPENKEIQQFVTGLIIEKHKLADGWELFLERKVIAPEENYIEELESSLHHLKFRNFEEMLNDLDSQIRSAKSDEEIEELLKVKIAVKTMQIDHAKSTGIVVW